MQPGQQQGRRTPSANSVYVRSMRRSRVSMSFALSTQQIHSLRASGVILFHASRADALAINAFFKSAGIACGVPWGRVMRVMFI